MAGHKTWALGEEVIQADFQPIIADQIVGQFATAATRSAGWPSPPVGAMSFLADTRTLHVYNGSVWVCITPVAQRVDGSNSTTSTGYVDLGGPSVSIATGAYALITLAGTINTALAPSAQGAYMSVEVSGATAVGAGDERAVGFVAIAGGHIATAGTTLLVGPINPGINTFSARYRVTTGNASFSARHISAVGLP